MSSSNAPTITAAPVGGDQASCRRSSPAGRRRWLLLFASVVLIAAAVFANIGPVRQLQDARARLDRTTANVAQLASQKTALQAELAKLSEASYLETIAREKLTYVLPGEELYIVTGPSVGAVSSSALSRSGIAAALPGVTRAAGSSEGDEAAGLAEGAGLLERLLAAIADVF